VRDLFLQGGVRTLRLRRSVTLAAHELRLCDL
jgi:hypothetical protein